MAKISLIVKANRLKEARRILAENPDGPRPWWFRKYKKYKTRVYNRCNICGRPRAYYRKFGICRVCLRKMAHLGEIPGIRKASW